MKETTFYQAMENLYSLSSQGTITGEFLYVMNNLGKAAENLQKLIGLL